MEHDLPGFPVQTVEIVHQLGGVSGFQHLQLGRWMTQRWAATARYFDKSLSDALLSLQSSKTTGDHRGMVLYFGSLVPNSVLTEKEAHHMLTHTLACFLYPSFSFLHMHTHQDAWNEYKHILKDAGSFSIFSGYRIK